VELNGFNAHDIDPAESREPIPAGWYKVVIAASEEKPTKAQTGSYLNLEMQVIDGDHAGRKVYDLLNLNNPNQTAVEIAQRTLSSICRAVGVMTPRQSDDLHDKPMMAKVAVRPAKDGYDARNEVKEYAPCDRAAPSSSPTTPGGAAVPPWKR